MDDDKNTKNNRKFFQFKKINPQLVWNEFIFIPDQNRFNKKLKNTTAIEREKLVLDIELQDQTAPANWFFNGKPIESNDR